MTADPYPLFSVFSFLGFVVALIPFPWHLQAWNAGTCMYMLWTAFASLIQFVNSILWHGNADIKATVWCDIATKFIIGAGVGIPASSLCINRRLYKIATVQAVTISRRERQRAIFIDLAIAGGIPILVMALHYIVQGHRFNIIEDIGCNPAIFNTPPAYPLVFIWPVALGCVSFVYALLTLRAFWRRRIQFQQFVSASTSMTFNRYLRLMLLSCLEMGLTVPLSAYSIYSNTAGRNLDPWISWSNAHFNFSHIEQVPSLLWRMNGKAVIALEMGRWLYPCCAFLFFALFGFAEEARRNYRTAFWWIATRLGLKRSTKPTYIGSSLSSSYVFIRGFLPLFNI
ncbi:STE3-like pheromone receptor [Abortiporus biennis]|nr:STE3-like pheromone receptor [Abortiporus biennis]